MMDIMIKMALVLSLDLAHMSLYGTSHNISGLSLKQIQARIQELLFNTGFDSLDTYCTAMTNVIDDTSMVPVVTQLDDELEDSCLTQGPQDQLNDGNGNCNRVTIIS